VTSTSRADDPMAFPDPAVDDGLRVLT